MPFGEMTITLDDVLSILGIPVSGATISPLEDDNDTNYELLVNYLGMPDEEAIEQLHKYSDGQLGQGSRFKVKQIAGYLEAWVYEHMHGVVVLDRDLDYSVVQPRALHWSPRRDNRTTSVDMHKYRHWLDTLNSD
ncbi:hypothetical protein L3X38_032612 [Prunus dulcis]|uniref:Uncharacterized protein n=1 Tax=Prunus dulcis TaxID=3755 RepID=A0AAD4VEG2_PRUDU|nr:hypothetical protein L3X38_032612 [Prunus dulcis]